MGICAFTKQGSIVTPYQIAINLSSQVSQLSARSIPSEGGAEGRKLKAGDPKFVFGGKSEASASALAQGRSYLVLENGRTKSREEPNPATHPPPASRLLRTGRGMFLKCDQSRLTEVDTPYSCGCL